MPRSRYPCAPCRGTRSLRDLQHGPSPGRSGGRRRPARRLSHIGTCRIPGSKIGFVSCGGSRGFTRRKPRPKVHPRPEAPGLEAHIHRLAAGQRGRWESERNRRRGSGSDRRRGRGEDATFFDRYGAASSRRGRWFRPRENQGKKAVPFLKQKGGRAMSSHPGPSSPAFILGPPLKDFPFTSLAEIGKERRVRRRSLAGTFWASIRSAIPYDSFFKLAGRLDPRHPALLGGLARRKGSSDHPYPVFTHQTIRRGLRPG